MFRRLFAITLCATLPACVDQTAAPGGPTTVSLFAGKKSMPTAGKKSMPEEREAAKTISPAPAQKAAIDPATLVGMTGDRVTALFGMPVFVRRDAPGEFWRYSSKTCMLVFFLYRQNGGQRVDHIETRNTGGTPMDQADCVAKLRKQPIEG